MQTVTSTVKVEFDAAHRIIGHQGKCKMLHGHRYVLEATFVADQLSQIGMVIDFGIVKSKLRDWLEKNWDHNVILSESDRDLGNAIALFTKQNVFYMRDHPTAENMAIFLMEEMRKNVFAKEKLVSCQKIRLWETPNCFAECVHS